MNKQELAQLIAQRTAEYHKPVLTYACSASQRDAVRRSLETRKKPVHLLQAEWEKYLQDVQAGTYTPAEIIDHEIYDYTGL